MKKSIFSLPALPVLIVIFLAAVCLFTARTAWAAAVTLGPNDQRLCSMSLPDQIGDPYGDYDWEEGWTNALKIGYAIPVNGADTYEEATRHIMMLLGQGEDITSPEIDNALTTMDSNIESMTQWGQAYRWLKMGKALVISRWGGHQEAINVGESVIDEFWRNNTWKDQLIGNPDYLYETGRDLQDLADIYRRANEPSNSVRCLYAIFTAYNEAQMPIPQYDVDDILQQALVCAQEFGEQWLIDTILSDMETLGVENH